MKSNILVWNVQGAASSTFPKVMKEYTCDFNPDMLILVETRVSDALANRAISKIGMPKSHRVEAWGFFGRIWVLWKECVEVIVLISSDQFVHLKVKFSVFSDWFLLTRVYGSPIGSLCKKLGVELEAISMGVQHPWLLAGDFNAMLNDWEKKGGLRNGGSSCRLFQNFCSVCNLRYVEFQGLTSTWSQGALFKRLDQVLCNVEWEQLAPASMVHHLHKLKSDHRPLALCFGGNVVLGQSRPFQFLSGWLSHSDFAKFVGDNWVAADSLEMTLTPFVEAAKKWNVEAFGHILQKKITLIACITGIQRCLEHYYSR